jgi:GrpB-like predicted nucleotidyltransferase (UPF0157 family)
MRRIEIVDYNPDWVIMFQKERALLADLLGPIMIACHHIGSTSVPGLAAKPIIDIMLEVGSLSELDCHTSGMEALGYESMGEYGIAGRRFFRKGGCDRTHHIHAFSAGDFNVERHLAFRDYLRLRPDRLREYAEIKQRVALECANDIEKYCHGKDAFVKNLEREALQHFQGQGKGEMW